MHTRPLAFATVFLLTCLPAMAQLGPTPQDEPLRSMSSARIGPATPASEPPRAPAGTEAAITLDEALIAGTRALQPDPIRSTQPVSTPADPQQQPIASSKTLGTPGRTALIGAEPEPRASPVFARGGMLQTILALGGILLLIFGLATLYKRLAQSKGGLVGAIGAGGTAPSGLVEVLGRYPVSGKMTLVVMRFDRRILLLSHAGGGRGKNATLGAMTTLCELDRPEDVASVLLKVRDLEGDSIAQSFARTLREADESQDQYLEEADFGTEQPRVRMPSRRRQPVQVVTNDAGDRAEFGTMTESEAAAGVLRKRLAAMREAEQQMNPYGATR